MSDNLQYSSDLVREGDKILPNTLRRAIWLVDDLENGETYTADEVLDNCSEDILFSMRASLTAAYKSGEYKYVCKECQQPLGLKIRTNEGDFFPFFSHYQNSDICSLKTQIDIDPSHTINRRISKFQESILYKNMLNRLSEVLQADNSFTNIELNRVISTPEIKGYRRPAIYAECSNNKKIAIDLLSFNPMLGLIVGRNAFYKMHKMLYMWIFPSFTKAHQKICQKDILYMNRRNVYVFDSRDDFSMNETALVKEAHTINHKYAYEESIRQHRLILNCYWQSPVITETDGEKKISIQWNGPELVAFEDLVFDEEASEVFYHDSDIDFYNSYPLEMQLLIDEWMRVKRDRWTKIFESIEKRKILYAQYMQRKERKEQLKYYYSLIDNGDVDITPFTDETTELKGYGVDGFEIIPAMYYDVKPFINGYAWARKKEKWGVIDIRNNRITNFQYTNLTDLGNGLFTVDSKRITYLVDFCGKRLISKGFYCIKRLSESLLIYRDYKETVSYRTYGYNSYPERSICGSKTWGILRTTGEVIKECTYDEILDAHNGKFIASKCTLWGILDASCSEISPFEFEEINEFVEGKAIARKFGRNGIIDENGKEVYDYIICNGNNIRLYKSNFLNKWGILDENDVHITELIFDSISEFKRGHAIASQGERYGVIDSLGNILIPFEFDEILDFEDGSARAKKNGREGIIDFCGDEIYTIYTIDGVTMCKSNFLNKIGILDENHDCHTGLIFDTISVFKQGRAVASQKCKYGIIDATGKTIVPFIYDKIEDFTGGKAKVKIAHKEGFIDEFGSEIFGEKAIADDSILYHSTLQGRFGIRNIDQSTDTGLIFKYVSKFYDGKAIAQKDGMYGIILASGEEIIPFEYDAIKWYNDHFMVEQNGYWGIIDIDQNILLPLEYTKIYHPQDGLIKVQKGYCYGVFSDTYRMIAPTKFNKIGDIKEGFVFARRGKWWKKYPISKNSENKCDLINLEKLKEDVVYASVVTGFIKIGVFIKLPDDIGQGLIPVNEITLANRKLKDFKRGSIISVRLLEKDVERKRATFSLVPN